MATLASIATGNWTAAGTWGLCDATSTNDSEAANTVLTTSYVESSTFTPGAITVSHIMVKVALRVGTTGTMSVHLAIAGVEVVGSAVTINVSDINAGGTAANGGCGWYAFKLASPLLLIAATAYSVGAKTSTGTMVNLFSSATTNWTRNLITTTTQAPTTSDLWHVAGEWTAAATSSTFTVTMNETATTAYGAGTINNKSVLNYGSTASTNYYLKTQTIYVHDGGFLQIGTVATPIPSTSSAVLEFNSASEAQHGLILRPGFTFIAQGATKTNLRTYMTTDEAAAQTVISGLTNTTGWLAGDEIVFPTTTRTGSECEKKTISTVDSSTQITLTAGLTNAHSGTAPIAAELANLTRNVKIRGVSSANTGYINVINNGVATLDMDYVEMYWFGGASIPAFLLANGAAGGAGSSVSVRYSSLHTSTTAIVGMRHSGTSNNANECSDNIVFNLNGTLIQIQNATSSALVLNNNYCIRSVAAHGFQLNDISGTITNNKGVGNNADGIQLSEANNTTVGTITGLEAHGNGANGIIFSGSSTNLWGNTYSNFTSWRNGTYGLSFTAVAQVANEINATFDTCTLFGNATAGSQVAPSFNSAGGILLFKNFTVNAGVTLTQPRGLSISGLNLDSFQLESCSFGATTTHSTADIDLQGPGILTMDMYNCTLASSTEINATATYLPLNRLTYKGISSTKHDGVAGAFKNWQRYGIITSDTTIFNTASPSMRITPNNTTNKQQCSSKFIPVASGGTATVSVATRKSTAGDGTAYNGNQPRLMVRKNLLAGITADTVIDTHTVAAGSWETLTGTSAAVSADCVLEFFIDCDGNLGWINVDDFTTTSSTDPTDFKYWIYGQPVLGNSSSGGSSGGSFTFS